VGADRGDNTPIEHNNAVGAAHRAETMRHDEGGATRHDLIHRSEDFLLRSRIDRRGGIVEDEDGRIEKDGPGEGETLALPAREVRPVFVEEGVVAER